MGADTVYLDCTRSIVMWDMALCLWLGRRSDKGLFYALMEKRREETCLVKAL